jgi:uronate dehydrogenase
MMRVLITGAAGRIGRCLRQGLSDDYALVLLDRRRQSPAGPGEELIELDLTDLAAAEAAMAGVDAVVHLAAQADLGAPWEKLLKDNIVSTHTVFEAARRAAVGRLVFASSNHVTGLYPASMTVGPDTPVGPDGLYGATKAFGEALARMYADRHGMAVACLRLGSFGQRPADLRQLSTWLSPRDCVQLFRRCLELPDLDFIIVYGTSANTRRYWTDEGWSKLGYRPEDDAEAFAAGVEGGAPAVRSH